MKIRMPQQYVAKITEISSLSQLYATQLVLLNLSNLALTSMPNFNIMETVETLILDNNQLTKAINLSFFPNLSHLSASNNKLREIQVPSSLRSLIISNNQLLTVCLNKLEIIDVRDNPLRSIQTTSNSTIKKAYIGWLSVLNHIPQFSKQMRCDATSLELQYKWETFALKDTQAETTFQDFLLKAVNLFYEFGDLDRNIIETECTDRSVREVADLRKFIKKDILLSCIQQGNKARFDQLLPLLHSLIYQNPEESLLGFAIRKSKFQFISSLLEVANMACEVDAFHQAIKQGQISLVKQMLDLGMDPNKTNGQGYTAITTAILNITQTHMHSIVQILLLSGANPNQYNRNGLTPVQMCTVKSNLTAIKFIHHHNSKRLVRREHIFKMNLKSASGDPTLQFAGPIICILKFLLENNIGNVFCKNAANIPLLETLAKGLALNRRFIIKFQRLKTVELLCRSARLRTESQESLEACSGGESSCPDVSDEEEQPNQPKLGKQEALEDLQHELAYVACEQSEEELEFEPWPDSQAQRILNNQSKRLSRMQELNSRLTRCCSDVRRIRQLSLIMAGFQKRRLGAEELHRYFNPKPEEVSKAICKLRIESQIYSQMIRFQDLVDQPIESHLQKLRAKIRELECAGQDAILGQYSWYQYF